MDLIHIRDDCWNASTDAHARIRKEWDIFNSGEYGEKERLLGEVPRAKASLNPQTRTGILRMIPPLMDQAVRIEIRPDKPGTPEEQETLYPEELRYTKDIANYVQMHEEARDESGVLETLILHNLVCGTAVAKTFLDERTGIIRSDPVHPLSIAVDYGASRVDLSDAMVVCQKTIWDEYYLRRHYGWEPKPERQTERSERRYARPTHRVDEIWMRREIAEDCSDINQDVLADTEKQMFRATLIDDEIVRVTASPLYWPDFPYAFWRNLTVVEGERQSSEIWGQGFCTHMHKPQKLLDEFLATVVAAARTMPTGQIVTTKGALDPEQDLSADGLVLEIDKSISDIREAFQHIPPHEISPIFEKLIQYFSGVLESEMPSLTPVFTGASPTGNASGKLANSLQWASRSQLSPHVIRMNAFRKIRTRQTATLVQQEAKAPLSPHLWRGNLNLPESFPEEARSVGFYLVANDASGLPRSPAGILEFLMGLASMGMIIKPGALLDVTGLDKGYGLTEDMFLPMGMQSGMMQPSLDVASGAEAPLP